VEKIKYLVSGDCTVCVEFGNEISPEINRRIRAFKIALEKEAIDGVVETIPTYRSLSVVYRPEVIRFGELTKKFDAVLETMDSIQIPPPSVIEIPVLYGGDMGPDLEFVAAHNHKTPEEVVRIHTSGEYLIYMLGFIAGFPYLGGMSREIAAPRLKSPRVKIEGGSVGIAGEQTGIYPVASPGGWQLIGRTPLKLYDAEREKPVLLEAGQYIKFRAVDEAEYEAIEKQVEAGTYQYVIFHKEVE
jgi:TIGR00370 family protein